jgi:hypothetical protein
LDDLSDAQASGCQRALGRAPNLFSDFYGSVKRNIKHFYLVEGVIVFPGGEA